MSVQPTTAITTALEQVHADLAGDDRGGLSEVYPALGEVDPALFGLTVATTGGDLVSVGDAAVDFTLMSVAKPFVLALEDQGRERVRGLVGVNATGRPFNSVEAVERAPGGRTNPMVNAGAIATTSLVAGATLEDRWDHLVVELSRFAGRALTLDRTVLASALATNHRNRALANLLAGVGALVGDPGEAVELYTRQSCLAVTASDLAVMGATLAGGGRNPATGEQVVGPGAAHDALAVMTVAGMYETSGDWLLDVGMPGKSGISGGLVCVSPGRGALGAFSPLLDRTGNTVRGQAAVRTLAGRLGLDMLAPPVPS